MEIENFGSNCFRLKTKNATIVIDDNLEKLGGKSITKDDYISVFTSTKAYEENTGRLVCDSPGEYEVADISLIGISAKAHTDNDNEKTSVIFKFIVDEVHLVVTGHISSKLTDDQLETIGHVDVLVVPVGGNGYTLDPIGAAEVIKKIEPKIIVPSQYNVKKLKYEVPAISLEEAVKQLNMEPKPAVEKLKIKSAELTEQPSLQIIEIQ